MSVHFKIMIVDLPLAVNVRYNRSFVGMSNGWEGGSSPDAWNLIQHFNFAHYKIRTLGLFED